MKEKHKNILQIILVFILIIGVLIFKEIPEYNKSKGSSDIYIDVEKYTDIVEITINNKPNFALVITENKISNILFFDEQAMCLYNQDIEGTSIDKGVNKVIEILIENNYLKQDYFLILTKYKSPSYNKIKESIMKSLNSFNATVTLQEENKTLEEKGKDLSITTIEENELLKEIELYSKNVIRHYKNNVSGTTQIKPEVITEETSREYADNVYKKIENYVRTNNIINQAKEDLTLEITKIPANNQGTIFPDETSWYYIQDKKVYAYISINHNNKNYSYCYQASIDDYKKGKC